jgi:hypothetical protein
MAHGERDLPEIWSEPLSIVAGALRRHRTWDALSQCLLALVDATEHGG